MLWGLWAIKKILKLNKMLRRSMGIIFIKQESLSSSMASFHSLKTDKKIKKLKHKERLKNSSKIYMVIIYQKVT